MLPSLLVAAMVTAPAAPIPKDTVPNTTGPAPRVCAVKADASGSVWITGHVYTKQKVQQPSVVIENNQRVIKQQEVEQVTAAYIRKSINEFAGKLTTAEGSALSTEEATRRLKDGATLLITADGKPIDKGWLKAVANDTVIVTAEGMGQIYFQAGYAPFPLTAAPRLTMLGTDENGAVRLPVNPNNNNNGQIYYGDNFNGRAKLRGRPIQIGEDVDGSYVASPNTATAAGSDGKKALADVKFDAYDATGKMVSRTEALNRLKAGGMVVLAGDNRFPDADHMKAFRSDVLVLVSNELVFPAGQSNPYDFQTKPVPTKPMTAPGDAAPPAQAVPAIGVVAPAVIKRVQRLEK